ncbi:MAG: hypothetical protein FH749_02930 [Firmicutes bacterium]|nr:hypothetical protein [Bacillota bacterium]
MKDKKMIVLVAIAVLVVGLGATIYSNVTGKTIRTNQAFSVPDELRNVKWEYKVLNVEEVNQERTLLGSPWH